MQQRIYVSGKDEIKENLKNISPKYSYIALVRRI